MLTIKSNAAVVDPNDEFEYLEKDYAIIRDVTNAMVDFGNPFTFSDDNLVSSDLPAGTTVKGLTDGASDGSVPVTITGGLTNGIVSLNAGTYVDLPISDFKPPVDGSVLKAVHIYWVNVNSTGYPSSVNPFALIAGDNNTTSNNYGRLMLRIESETENADVTQIYWSGYGAGNGFTNSGLIANATDGMHQLAFTFEDLGDGNARIELYIDNVFSAVVTVPIAGVLPTGGSSYTIGAASSSAFNSNLNAFMNVGRVSVSDFTNREDLNMVDYINRDWEHGRQYYDL